MILTASAAAAQVPAPVADRYGLAARPDSYPQGTPKDALTSLIRAADGGRVEYLAAHLLDPVFVDGRVAERARRLEPAVEADLLAARDRQRQGSAAVEPPARLPDDPAGFADAVRAEAVRRAFGQVAREVRDYLADNPDHVKALRRFARIGDVAEAGEGAKISLKDVPDRAVYLRKVGPRWFVEDRQTDAGGPPGK